MFQLRIRLGFFAFSCLVCVLFSGCSSNSANTVSNTTADGEKAEEPIKANGPLRILVLDDEEFAKILSREWQATSEHEIEVRNESVASFAESLQAGQKLDADAVIGPSALVGEMAARKFLRSLPKEITRTDGESAYRMDQVFSAVARKELQWDKRPFAVSFGSPVMLLLSRRDLLPNPPQTWSQLEKVREELAKSEASTEVVPLLQPLGKGWAAKTFLSRSASYLFHPSRISSFFDYANLAPRIATPPCVRALEEMKKSYRKEDLVRDPRDVFEQFLAGKSAMALCWPTKLPADAAQEPLNFGIQVSELPGLTESYDWRDEAWIPFEDAEEIRRVPVVGTSGMAGAISRSAKNPKLAGIFLGWATSPEQSVQLCPRGKVSAPFRRSHREAVKLWCDDRLDNEALVSYMDAMESALKRSECYLSVRLPGSQQYMNSLDAHVLKALQGEMSAREALEKVRDEWNTITEQLGPEKQVEAYRHSIGIDVD